MSARIVRGTLQRVLTLALEASHAAAEREFAEIVLDGAQRLVAADIISYNEVAASGQVDHVSLPPAPSWFTADLSRAWERSHHEHPLIAHYRRTGDGRALKISDFLSRESFHALSLYREFFGPLGIEDQIAVTLPSTQATLIGIALNRGSDFSERERAVLNMLRPYLARAYGAVRERERMRSRLDALEHAVAEVSDGIVVLGSDGRIAEANPAARALARGLLGVELDEHLPPELSRPFAERDGRRLYIRRVGGDDTGVLLLSTAPPPSSHGLTPRELEVLASAADGFTASQIAARLGIGERTVERHLQNTYRKLDVHGRGAAIARVFGTPHQAIA